ncbi:MAG: Bug family tripartite tricarboxylate transporter substrate binding protein [Burkholderiales bacterium]
MKISAFPRSLVVLFLATLAIGAPSASAQNFPSKPIRIIVPYAAGGLVELMARSVGPFLTDSMGQPIVVETRPGGSAIIGMQACATAAPDGHTLCLAVADALSYNPALFSDLPFNPDTDFAPVINMGLSNNLLVAHAKAPFSNYKEMIAYAKANPGKLNWATWGAASLPDLYLQWIRRSAGVDIAGIPYKGAGQANPAVISGEANITYMGFGVSAPLIKAEKLKPIVAVGTRRSSFMPALSTLGEEGGDPGLQGYFAMFAPGKTPKPIVDKLNAELARAIRTPKMLDFYKTYTLELVDNTAEQFAQFARADRENALKVFRSIGIKPTKAPE